MFRPNYKITNRLLKFITDIHEAKITLANNHLILQNMVKFKQDARALSSFSSTSIEGNPLALTDVRKILKTAPTHLRDTQKEVLNYNQALENIDKQITNNSWQLSVESIESIHGLITKEVLINSFHVGALRKDAVVLRDPRIQDSIIFMPPNHNDVPELLQDLCNFVNTNKDHIDPLILAGLFHRQFVIIHPFMDGNGRTTRVVSSAILAASGLGINSIFSFENYYNQNVSRYFSEVGEKGDYYEIVSKIDHTAWLEYFCEGILDELNRFSKYSEQFQEIDSPHLNIVLDFIDLHGSIDQKRYGDISERSLASRKKDFKELLDLGLIKRIGLGKNTKYERS